MATPEGNGPAVPPPPSGGGGSSEENTWGMLCHLSALAGIIVPFGNVLGPLIIWLVKKDQMPVVEDQGKESLNFQITLTLAMIVASLLMIVLIGFLLLPLVALAGIILVIMAAVAANKGERYRYPWTLRLVK